MGVNGHNAGGFDWMEIVSCPRCGFRRRLGYQAINDKRTKCSDTEKCDARKEKVIF